MILFQGRGALDDFCIMFVYGVPAMASTVKRPFAFQTSIPWFTSSLVDTHFCFVPFTGRIARNREAYATQHIASLKPCTFNIMRDGNYNEFSISGCIMKFCCEDYLKTSGWWGYKIALTCICWRERSITKDKARYVRWQITPRKCT